MAVNISTYGPQPQLCVTVKQIEIITNSDDEDNKEAETHTSQSSLDSHKSHDHHIQNTILDSLTNSQEITTRKSCIVQKRESVVRKLIETIGISDDGDEDEDPTHTSQNQDISSSKSHQIPACLTSWKKQTANLDEKIVSDPEYQSVLLNLKDLSNTQLTSPSECVQPIITPKSGTEASFQCNRNKNEPERNFSVIHGPNIQNISVIKEVTPEAGFVPVNKSENIVLNTDSDPEVFKKEAQHDDLSPATDVKEQVVNSSEHRSKTLSIGHVTDEVKSTNSSSIVERVANVFRNTSSWKMTDKKSCSGHRGALKRKPIPIEKRNILDDKIDDPTSLESQKSHIPNPIPDTATSWRKWRDSLDNNISGRTKKQGADSNLTPVDKSERHSSSKSTTIFTDAVRKSKTLLTSKVTQRNTSATADTGVTVLVNSALNKVKLDESYQVSKKSEKTVCWVVLKRMVTHASVELPADAEIASSSKSLMPSKLLGKDAVNSKFQNQERRPTHTIGLCKTTMKKCLAQEQQSQRSGDDSGVASILTTRKPLLRNQKQGQQRDRRFLLLHDKNLTRVLPVSGRVYYICNFCRKTFETHTKGRRHVRVHTGDKPYKCSHCGRRFSQNSHVKEHQNYHADNQQFKCKFCTKIFLHWCSRRKHQNICGKKKN